MGLNRKAKICYLMSTNGPKQDPLIDIKKTIFVILLRRLFDIKQHISAILFMPFGWH
jgi:hypothetical protein